MVLVTGGTGLVGAHLLLRLMQDKRPVKALRRKESDISTVKKVFSYYTENFEELFNHIQWVTADLLDIEALAVAFENVTQVYHCAALISFDPADEEALTKINVEGTANIVNFCVAGKVQKLCYVSSIAAIGKNPNGTPSTEENEWNDEHANVYALSKNAAEIEVWRASQENLPVIIINPGVILGPGFWYTGSGLFFTVASKKRTFFPPGGTGFVSVSDVVRIMVGIMDLPIVNERYIAVSDNLTYKEVLEKIAVGLNVAPPKKKLPFWLLEVLWRLDWMLSLLSQGGRKLTKDTVYSLKNPTSYSNQKIRATLQFNFEPIAHSITFCSGIYLKEQTENIKAAY